MSQPLCPHCAEPLDDYGPCACGLATSRPQAKARDRRPGQVHTSMRVMVERKLQKQGKR